MSKELKTYLDTINQNFEILKTRFNVKKIAIFGSTVRNQNTKKSDIDIIVELIEPIGLFDFIRLEAFLAKILGKKIDLTTKQALKPTIKKAVLKEAIYA